MKNSLKWLFFYYFEENIEMRTEKLLLQWLLL